MNTCRDIQGNVQPQDTCLLGEVVDHGKSGSGDPLTCPPMNIHSERQIGSHEQFSRQILLTRSPEHGFGFTLRHLIVYPPQNPSDIEFEEEKFLLGLTEPLDTIFVKQVKPGSPSAFAGLSIGDRILSVNEESVHFRSYSDIVSIIQLSPTYLRLVVLPKEHDILQQVYSQAAYNPESNLNVRYTSTPEPALNSLSSSWSSRSSLSSIHPNYSPTCFPPQESISLPYDLSKVYSNSVVSEPFSEAPNMSGANTHRKGSTPVVKANLPITGGSQNTPKSSSQTQNKRKPTSNKDTKKKRSPVVMDRKQAVYNIQNALDSPKGQSGDSSKDTSKSRPPDKKIDSNSTPLNGVYEPLDTQGSSKNLEKDPDGRVYELVQTKIVDNSVLSTGELPPAFDKRHSLPLVKSTKSSSSERKDIRNNSLPRMKKMHSSSSFDSNKDYSSPNNKENIDKAHSASQSSLDQHTQEVIERIKKNVERKEEFLKRPVQPILKLGSQIDCSPKSNNKMWPPPLPCPPSPSTICKTLTFVRPSKQDKSSSRRSVKSDDGMSDSVASTDLFFPDKIDEDPDLEEEMSNDFVPSSPITTLSTSLPTLPRSSFSSPTTTPPDLTSPLVLSSPVKPHTSEDHSSTTTKYNRPFISKLARIHENIPTSSAETPTGKTPNFNPFASLPTPYSTPLGSQTSLSSLPATPVAKTVPLVWVNDNERIRQLQIVSTRAKRFETYNAEREERKMAFYRFELWRLSQKANAFNVADRKKEFEKKSTTGQKHRQGSLMEPGICFNCPPRPSMPAPSTKLVKSASDVGTKGYWSEPEASSSTSSISTDIPKIRGGKNRTIPVGSNKIHCDPPESLSFLEGMPDNECDTFERTRANSTCSHDSFWLNQSLSSPHRQKKSPLVRQHSFHSTLQSHLARAVSSIQQRLSTGSDGSVGSPAVSATLPGAAGVPKREKHLLEEPDRLTRRVSYLKATSGERAPPVDSDSDDDRPQGTFSPGAFARRVTGAHERIQPEDLPSPASILSNVSSSGPLQFKLDKLNGKRAGDRSWKCVWVVMRGSALLLYKDKVQATQTPLSPEDQVTLRGADVSVALDYTKKKNVFRLSTPSGSQFLFQADSEPTMTAWMSSIAAASSNDIRKETIPSSISEGLSPWDIPNSGSLSTTPTSSASGFPIASENTPSSEENVSPQLASKNAKKISSARNKSPGNLQVAQKSSKKSAAEVGSPPKPKTWKRRLGRHLRRMQGGSPSVPPLAPLPEGASVGVCLEDCPPSSENPFVPLLVSICVGVAESKGMHVQGIYRIPGNRAAVTHLTECVNRGSNEIDLSDPRWSDVNVISSLLKQFFQKLPDPLIPTDLYNNFIEASKLEDPHQRLIELKHLIQELPDHHYETLRFLCVHLNHVTSNSDTNKMDVRNLAIVFGPTLIRASDDNMAKMVTDMSHQCRIVELLISQVNWFFSEDETDEPPPVALTAGGQNPLGLDSGFNAPALESASQSLLLGNVQKLEASQKEQKKMLVTSIISAANRRVQKVRRKTEDDHETQPFDGSQGHDETPEVPVDSLQSRIGFSRESGGQDFGLTNSFSGSNRDGRIFADGPHPVYNLRDEPSSGGYDYGPPDPPFDPVNSASLDDQPPHPTPDLQETRVDVPIRSYSGLNANTQERVRKFEQETKAMLQRETQRRRRELLDKQKIEEELVRAKKDLETEDIFDRLADNPSQVVHMMNNYCWSPNRETIGSATYHQPALRPFLPSGCTNASAKEENLHRNDSLAVNEPKHNVEGSDLLSAINATFEKMKSSHDQSPVGDVPDFEPERPITPVGLTTPRTVSTGRGGLRPDDDGGSGPGGKTCKLYRDPSLHRRRVIDSDDSGTGSLTPVTTQLNGHDNLALLPPTSEVLSLDASEGALKEKNEKRSRDLTRTEAQEGLKRPKELKRSMDAQERLRSTSPSSKREDQRDPEAILKSSEMRSRRHNVKELKAKFESNPPNSGSSSGQNSTGEKVSRASLKQARKARIKRRHTVGGMKDSARVAWVKVIEAANSTEPRYAPVDYQLPPDGAERPSWERLQSFIEALAEERKLNIDPKAVNSWVAKEQLGASTPDLDNILSLLLSPPQKEALKRRLSVREPLKPLYPVLESNV